MSGPHHTRRKFLKGQAASDILSSLSDTVEDFPVPAQLARPAAGPPNVTVLPQSSSGSRRESFLVSVRRRAMACEFEVQLAASRDDDSMEHVFAALDLLESLEAQMTVYRGDSEVIRINREATSRPVSVEPRLFAMFQLAERVHLETGGALDITSGPLSEAWGFSRREGRIPKAAAIESALDRVGMRNVVLNAAERTVAFRRPDVNVNFNCIGKGYALDRMAELLATHLVDDYLLHGGKSSVLARGQQPGATRASENSGGPKNTEPAPPTRGGWIIGLRHPLRPAQRLAEFVLRDQALSTSGSGTQFFIRRGRRYGHILDPRTGRPAEGMYSATVVAPTAADADALSTAFYVMGPAAVSEYCLKHPEIGALLIVPGPREGDVRLLHFGLNEDQWRQVL
jgi:thiamine biosynthesis lipoprotein